MVVVADDPCGPKELLRGLARCYSVIARCCKEGIVCRSVRKVIDVSPFRGPQDPGNGIYREPSEIYDREFLIPRDGVQDVVGVSKPAGSFIHTYIKSGFHYRISLRRDNSTRVDRSMRYSSARWK